MLLPVSCGRIYSMVLLQPCEALSTKDVFTAYHQSTVEKADTEGTIQALASGELSGIASCARNELETVSLAMRPEIARAKADLKALGAGMAQMTGSGSVVFGAFEDEESAGQAYEKLKKQYAVCILTETAL